MRRNFFTIFKDLENLMNDDFLTDFNVTLKNDLDKNIKRYTSNRPLTNVYEDEWSFRYEIFTPGFLKKEISIEVKDGSIEVTGVLDKEDKGKSGDCIIKEFNLNPGEIKKIKPIQIIDLLDCEINALSNLITLCESKNNCDRKWEKK